MTQASAPSSATLARWMERLSDREMPVLNDTVQRLCSISTDEGSSANDLAGVVLRDASMTSGVLKIANSAYYNSAGREINTISRAVVLLGFDTVRSIGLSQTLIDAFLQGGARQRLVELMQESVYAAVQAKLIAEKAGDPGPEEIFIAALLYRLGEMAFWAFATDAEAAALEQALAEPGATPQQAQRQALGFDLRTLSVSLAREWRLGPVVQDALKAPPGQPPKGRAASVQLGHKLESAVRSGGWASKSAARATQAIAQYTGLNAGQMKELLESSQLALKKAADAFGIRLDPKKPEQTQADEEERQHEALTPDPMLQLKVLRELSSMLPQGPDPQVILDMVMEGIYRGIAMDRTALTVLTPDRKELRLKYALGGKHERLASDLRFNLSDPSSRLIVQALSGDGPLWAAQLTSSERAKLLDQGLQSRLALDFYLGPLRVRGKPIGLIYADRRFSRRPLDQEGYDAFRHFLQQANLALDYLLG